MEKKSEQPVSKAELEQLASSEHGKKLIELLKKQKGRELEDAMQALSEGDCSKAQETIRNFLATPEAQELYKKLGR